jgi:hypothetical protein
MFATVSLSCRALSEDDGRRIAEKLRRNTVLQTLRYVADAEAMLPVCVSRAAQRGGSTLPLRHVTAHHTGKPRRCVFG